MANRGDAGHEKKFKNHQNCKFGLNEIKCLQLLIFTKRDFFSDRREPGVNRFRRTKGKNYRDGN
jgi:hypothetical protein